MNSPPGTRTLLATACGVPYEGTQQGARPLQWWTVSQSAGSGHEIYGLLSFAHLPAQFNRRVSSAPHLVLALVCCGDDGFRCEGEPISAASAVWETSFIERLSDLLLCFLGGLYFREACWRLFFFMQLPLCGTYMSTSGFHCYTYR